MKEYVLTEKDLEYLKKALYTPEYWKDPKLPNESIMLSDEMKWGSGDDALYLIERGIGSKCIVEDGFSMLMIAAGEGLCKCV